MRFYGAILIAIWAVLAGCSRPPAKVTVMNGSNVTVRNVWVYGEHTAQRLGWMMPGMSVSFALSAPVENGLWLSFEVGGQKFDSRGTYLSNFCRADSSSYLSLTIAPDLKIGCTNRVVKH